MGISQHIRFKWLLVPIAIGISSCFAQQAKEGFNKLYYPNGKISSEGTIRDGKPDGYWKNYYESGKLKSEGNRKDFKLDSLWKFYTQKGLLYLIYTYKSGKKTGLKYIYSPNLKDSSAGVLVSKENFVSDTLQGISIYYQDGKLRQIIFYKDGLAEGKSLQFNKDSLITSIIIYKGGFIKKITKINQLNTEGHKEGVWQTFYPMGVVSSKSSVVSQNTPLPLDSLRLTTNDLRLQWEGTYTDGKRDGYFKTYSPKGDLLTVEKYINDVLQENPPELAKLDIKTTYYSNGVVQTSGPYKDNVPVGMHRFYDETGKANKADVYDSGRIVATGAIDDGDMQQGDWREYYENGDLKAEGKYVNGVKVGEWKYYFSRQSAVDSGQVKPNKSQQMFEIGKYDNSGKQTGKWLWYFGDGKVRRESHYTKGQEDGDFIEYNDSGNVITNGLYLDGMKEGTWIYQEGNFKSVGRYNDDLEDSAWTEYYRDNGKIRFTGKYNQGRPDGIHIWYYPDGKTEIEGQYTLGLKEGKWKYYNLDGTLFLTITFRDDEEVKYDATEVAK